MCEIVREYKLYPRSYLLVRGNYGYLSLRNILVNFYQCFPP